MGTNISTLGQQTSLIARLKEIQSQMSAYQQQVSTGLKHQTFKEYGADSLRIQRYRTDMLSIDGYIYNIDIAKNNIEQMNAAIDESVTQAGNVLTGISVQLARGSEFDLENIKSAAATALQVIQANMNAKVGDRYLFAGTDVSNPPYDGANTAISGVQARISDWLDGTTNTAAFLTGLDGMTDSQLGFSTTLQSAKNVFARVDDTFEVDYTVFANDPGFQKVVEGLTALSQMEFPTEGTDIPTKDEFYEVLNALYQTVQAGVSGLRDSSAKVASAAQAMQSVRDNHQNDKQNLQQVLEKTESADVTDAVLKFQTLQTQLEASFQTTAILSQLSLARILGA